MIEKQNNVEDDLYCVVAPLLKKITNRKYYSIRNVSNRIRTDNQNGRVFWGIKGFPDLVIIESDYVSNNQNTKSKIHAVVEVKHVNKPFFKDPRDILQLKGHLLSFGTVLYTNGYEWRIYKNTNLYNKDEIEDKEQESYDADYKDDDKWDMINKWVDNEIPSLEDYLFDKFVLKKDEESAWNKQEWNRLIGELNKLFSINEEIK